MKTAITTSGKEVQAGPGAPAVATCPACGAKLLLRRHGPAWAYHHATAAPACPRAWRVPVAPREQPEPEYFVFIAAIREAIKDALDGGGPQALEWLFSPEAQAALCQLLGRDAEQTLVATEQAVERLKAVIAAGQGHRLRRCVALNAFEQVERILGFAERGNGNGKDQTVRC